MKNKPQHRELSVWVQKCETGPQVLVHKKSKNHKKKEMLTFARVVTKAELTFKTSTGRPAVISNPGLSRENPALSHRNSLSLTHSLTHSDSPDDIVHYGLARKHKKILPHSP